MGRGRSDQRRGDTGVAACGFSMAPVLGYTRVSSRGPARIIRTVRPDNWDRAPSPRPCDTGAPYQHTPSPRPDVRVRAGLALANLRSADRDGRSGANVLLLLC